MSEQVTLTFEQFDETDDNTFSYQGPINLYKAIPTFDLLDAVADEVDFPQPTLNDDNTFDLTSLPNVVVYVKNVTNYEDSKRYRGAYFRYDYVNGSWQEIMLGTHSHENKAIIDKITSGNIGTWTNLTEYSSVIYGTAGLIAARQAQVLTIAEVGNYYLEVGEDLTPNVIDPRILYQVISVGSSPSVTYEWDLKEKNTNTLFIDVTNVLLYKANRDATNPSAIAMTWGTLDITSGTSMPLEPTIGDVFLKTIDDNLYIFAGAGSGDRKMLVLEVTDPDDSELTYSYDVAWTEMPESLPLIPEDTEETSYLGLDSAKNPVWKNTLLPSQVFQIKTITVVPAATEEGDLGTDEWYAGNSINIDDVSYDPDLDEVLVMDGNFFSHNRTIGYRADLRVMTVTANEDADGSTDDDFFDSGSVITVIIIRNGASAVLDTLASDYVTKADAINLLSGGSINLNQYATKTDMQNYMLRGHYHSGYSRTEHNHDNRYANYNHTHANYLTRRKALELIEETIGMNPSILTTLTSISDYLAANVGTLGTLLSELADVTDMKVEIIDLQDQIDVINTTAAILADHVDNRRIKTDQIDTEFNGGSETGFQPKDLTQVLQEIMDTINSDLLVTDSSNLFLDEAITVQLGDENIGEYDSDDVISSNTTLQQILENILRKRIVPTPLAPSIVYDIRIDLHPEIGKNVAAIVTPEYVRNDGGSLELYRLSYDGINLVSSTTADEFIDTILVDTAPITLNVYATYAQGALVEDNFGDEVGQIEAGIISEAIATITPVRALFHGGLTTAQTTFISADIRSLNRTTELNYDEITVTSTIPIGTQTIILALPVGGTLASIDYNGEDILLDFSTTTINVEGANGASGINYTVYYYKLPFESAHIMNLTFITE